MTRNQATKHLGMARIDLREARYFCQHSRENTRRQAKREAKKARRMLDRISIHEEV